VNQYYSLPTTEEFFNRIDQKQSQQILGPGYEIGGRIIDRQKAAHRLANGLIEYLML
jgi:hypothetical protein